MSLIRCLGRSFLITISLSVSIAILAGWVNIAVKGDFPWNLVAWFLMVWGVTAILVHGEHKGWFDDDGFDE